MMKDADKKNIIKVEPGTMLAIVTVLLLVPLLLMGFLFQ
jgi:hypothetical protein